MVDGSAMGVLQHEAEVRETKGGGQGSAVRRIMKRGPGGNDTETGGSWQRERSLQRNQEANAADSGG